MKILINDDIKQSYIKLLLKHFMAFWQIEVSLFLSSPLQLIDENTDNWWYATILYKDGTDTLDAFSEGWGAASPVISISNNPYTKVPDNWWYTTIGYKAVTETLHAPFDKLRCRFSCHLHFKNSMKILTIVDIQQSYINLLLKHFMPFPHIEVSLFLSSPFLIFDEDPDNWWYTTIVCKAVTETFHAVSTSRGVTFPVICISKNRGRSWQLMIYNNRK